MKYSVVAVTLLAFAFAVSSQVLSLTSVPDLAACNDEGRPASNAPINRVRSQVAFEITGISYAIKGVGGQGKFVVFSSTGSLLYSSSPVSFASSSSYQYVNSASMSLSLPAGDYFVGMISNTEANHCYTNPSSYSGDFSSVGHGNMRFFDNPTMNFYDGSVVIAMKLFTAPVAVCGNGIVEASEQCDGGACCSTSCTFLSSATTCRAATGSCDVAEKCTGTSASCPADQLSMTGPCFCSRMPLTQSNDVVVDYFCTSSNSTQFYMCMSGAFAPQSRAMSCGAGTRCGCAEGTECSCSRTKSPCVHSSSVQQC